MADVAVVGSVRQRCLGCGGSCRGVNVRPVDEAERDAVAARAATLGIEGVWVDGRLARRDGACVLLDDQDRCRLHAAFGAESKPWVCRQYPVVVVATESGPRLGVDPGCYTHRQTWLEGPDVRGGPVRGARKTLPPAAVAEEEAVQARLARSHTVIEALVALGGDDVAGLAARTAARIRAARLPEVVARLDLGPTWSEALTRVGEAARDWDPSDPPDVALSAGLDAYVKDATARLVGLRLLPRGLGGPAGAAFLGLVGGWVAAWTTAAPAEQGVVYAAWARSMRSPPVVAALIPRPDALSSWVRGGAG